MNFEKCRVTTDYIGRLLMKVKKKKTLPMISDHFRYLRVFSDHFGTILIFFGLWVTDVNYIGLD